MNITSIINQGQKALLSLTLSCIEFHFLKIILLLFCFSLTRHEAGLLETMNSKYQAFGTLDGREKEKTQNQNKTLK